MVCLGPLFRSTRVWKNKDETRKFPVQVVIMGPSGSGKESTEAKLRVEFPERLGLMGVVRIDDCVENRPMYKEFMKKFLSGKGIAKTTARMQINATVNELNDAEMKDIADQYFLTRDRGGCTWESMEKSIKFLENGDTLFYEITGREYPSSFIKMAEKEGKGKNYETWVVGNLVEYCDRTVEGGQALGWGLQRRKQWRVSEAVEKFMKHDNAPAPRIPNFKSYIKGAVEVKTYIKTMLKILDCVKPERERSHTFAGDCPPEKIDRVILYDNNGEKGAIHKVFDSQEFPEWRQARDMVKKMTPPEKCPEGLRL